MRNFCISFLGFAALLTVPGHVQADWPGAKYLDEQVENAVQEGLTPGAVVWVESAGEQLHFSSYGSRSLMPQREPMTRETIFDCASLTKVIATAPAIMMLVEQGKVRLSDSIKTYLTDFQDSTTITVLQLLTHFSGLRPDVDIEPTWSGYKTGVNLALQEKPIHPPGTRFVYSDINYILLAEIVSRSSGVPFHEFVKQYIFDPLKMHDTGFLPPARVRERIAPTEQLADGTLLHGVVHDPSTRMMGGVSGHAGVFSTATDLARFARMMLNEGQLDGVRILSPLSVLRMTTPQSPGQKDDRGIGWDINSPSASPRGDLFTMASYGHTGYTGTSIWIDPISDSFVVLLTNRVHPQVKTSVVRLRSLLASITAATLDHVDTAAVRRIRLGLEQHDVPIVSNVLSGLDVLVSENFQQLHEKKIGLITNHTGIDHLGRRNIDLLAEAKNVSLELIFTPEHGLEGMLDQSEIADGIDSRSGVDVYSLYRENRRRPPVELLQGLDALVFDIQDIGARFYTYITTMGYAMEVAAQVGLEFYVLDRPNPINGVTVEGPLLEDGLQSFIGYHSLPVRHGMTVGELAHMFREERSLDLDLKVVSMKGWSRNLWFDETGLPWVNPSPNIRSLDQAILYPGIALLEGLKNYSVGRGTDAPFQFTGADWINGPKLAALLREEAIPGIRIYSRKQRPDASAFQGSEIDGIQFSIVDRNSLRSVQLGLAIAAGLKRLYPAQLNLEQTAKLIGNRRVISDINQGLDARTIAENYSDDIEAFLARRRPFLTYKD